MAATPPEPPILRLNHDLFLYILKMNADMFSDDDALKTTRITSQVCRRWRNFMLSTPSLWAKLIDLTSLQHRTADAWRNELMRRTGTALLWIAARKYPVSDNSTVSFFFDTLSKYWHRIQKIVVPAIDYSHMHPRPRWTPLYLPAPNLQTFDINFYAGEFPNENCDEEYGDVPLFSNNAPMLREFYSRDCRFDLGASWLHHLHLLYIDIDLTIKEILTILEAAPCLKDVEIHEAELGEATSSLPVISLPDLSRLSLFAELMVGATLLDHLEFPLGCTMQISLSTGVDDPSEELCCFCMQTVSRVARNNFQVHTPQKLALNCSPGTLALEADTEAGTRFEFRIWHPTISMSTMFFEGFTLPELSKVTEFCFENSIELPETVFASFISCLSSVTILDAPERTIDYLVEFQDGLNEQADRSIVIFPLVKTVKLDNLGLTYFRGDQGALMEYLLARIEDGCPISTLDLTQCNLGVLPRLDFLEEMTGLKVLWKRWEVNDISEYVCGSGDPDRLRILHSDVHWVLSTG